MAFAGGRINIGASISTVLKKEQMKKIIWILLMTIVANIQAADMTPTNAPATNAPPAKGDRSDKADARQERRGNHSRRDAQTRLHHQHRHHRRRGRQVYCRNRHVADPQTPTAPPAPRFFTSPTRGLVKTNMATRPVTFSFNGGPGVVVRVDASGRTRPAPGEDEPRRHPAAAARSAWWTTNILCWARAIWCSLTRWRRVTAARRRREGGTIFW